jgi:hypothetical protein
MRRSKSQIANRQSQISMDPYTLVIEGIGVVIACVFTVVPAREFAEIFRRLRSQPPRMLLESPGGFEVMSPPPPDASDQPPEGRA